MDQKIKTGGILPAFHKLPVRLACGIFTAALVLSMLSGCGSISAFQQEKKEPSEEVSLELGDGKTKQETEQEKEEPLESETENQPKEPETVQEPEKQEEIPSPEQEGQPSGTQAGQTESGQGCILEESPHILCVLPETELTPNPRNLDSKLFAIIRNVTDEAFSRRKGNIHVEISGPDGAEEQLMNYDVSAAFDEEGKADPDAEITADIKIARQLGSAGYGEGSRPVYEYYWEFEQALTKLKTPYFTEGLMLANLSALDYEMRKETILITAVFDSAAAEELSEGELSGTLQARAELTKKGELIQLGLREVKADGEQLEILSERCYTFEME